VAAVLDSGILVHGKKTSAFETAFAEFIGGGACAAVSNCTAGLHLAYFCLEVGPGDEVIVPAQTHVATAHAVELVGATPVFVDSELQTGNVDIDQIEAAITAKTRAISIVHFLGMPVKMDRITQLAQKHQLYVIEDCALALGATYRDIPVGLHGDAGSFSFYPVKHMTTGEGGMVVSTHQDLTTKIKASAAFGIDRHYNQRTIPGMYDVTSLGFNYRMSEIEATLGLEQIKRVRSFLEIRRANFTLLDQLLREIDAIHLFDHTEPHGRSSYYCLSVVLHDKIAARRPEFINFLNSRGVGTSVYYPHPVPRLSYYQRKYALDCSSYPNASRISDHSVALPVGPHLDADDMRYIADTVKNFLAGGH